MYWGGQSGVSARLVAACVAGVLAGACDTHGLQPVGAAWYLRVDLPFDRVDGKSRLSLGRNDGRRFEIVDTRILDVFYLGNDCVVYSNVTEAGVQVRGACDNRTPALLWTGGSPHDFEFGADGLTIRPWTESPDRAGSPAGRLKVAVEEVRRVATAAVVRKAKWRELETSKATAGLAPGVRASAVP